MSGERRGPRSRRSAMSASACCGSKSSSAQGARQFIDDLPVKKGTLHAAVLRSPLAHADIAGIDVSAALRAPA